MKKCKNAEELYNKYKYLLYDISNSILNNSKLSEAVVQQTIQTVIDNYKLFRTLDETRIINLSCIITRNLAYNLSGKQEKMIQSLISLKENEVEEVFVNDENMAKIKTAMNELPFIYRDVIILEIVYRLKIDEIAILLNNNEQIIKERSQLGRKILLVSLKGSDDSVTKG